MKSKRLSLERKKSYAGYGYMIPLIFGLLVLFFPNMIQTVVFTFNDIKQVGGEFVRTSVGLENYTKAFTGDIRFKTYLVNNLVSLISQIPVIVIFSLFISVVLNQKFRGRIVTRTVFFLPVILATGILLSVENDTKILSSAVSESTQSAEGREMMSGITDMLSQIGIGQGLVEVIVAAANGIYNVVMSSGIQIFIFLAALQEVSPSYYEAAKVEGCDGWQSFWKITFPLISPQIVVCLVYTTVDIFTKPNTELDKYIYSQTYASNQYGYGTTMSLLYFVCIALIMGVVGGLAGKLIFGSGGKKHG